MEDGEAVSLTVAGTGFISGNENVKNYSDDAFSNRRWKLHVLPQVGKNFLTSMGIWTIVVVISLTSLTRLPDASESRS